MTQFKIRVDKRTPSHVHFTVFAGPTKSTLGNCGTLCMRTEEYGVFVDTISFGAAESGLCLP